MEITENKENKIVIESSLMDQVWYQIDKYLHKKWPDIFIHGELRKLKKKIENGLEHLEEDQVRSGIYREREIRIDKLLFEMQKEINSLKEKIHSLDSKEVMKFWEAMKAVEEGKKVRMKSWPSGEYVHLDRHLCIVCEDGSEWNASINDVVDIQEEWELYSMPQHRMSFSQAIQGVREGKRVVRHSWGEDGVPPIDSGNLNDCCFSLEDFEGTDWVERVP